MYTYSSSSASNSAFSLIATVVLTIATLLSACSSDAKTLDAYEYFRILAGNKSPQTHKATTYLYNHLSKRAAGREIVLKEGQAADNNEFCANIVVEIDPSMAESYEIGHPEENTYSLRAKSPEIMLWLSYQLMSGIAQNDRRIEAADLPPAIVQFDKNESINFAFEYRAIYSPSNGNPDLFGIMGTNSIDYDWGIWGHNLPKILKDTHDESIFALSGGKRDSEQFCFSSQTLFNGICAFIEENYGYGSNGKGERFCIMPNDNDIVCTCPACKAAGNTATNATPAVCDLLNKLARMYPNHTFFTSAYSTTATPPSKPLPKNTGCIVSAIDLPLSTKSIQNNHGKKFANTVEQWKSKVGRIYAWDYMRNFDDYFTPAPIIGIMAKRLAFYKELGVKGIIINGSGDSYSSFDDVQTFALSSLLINPSLDTEKLCRDYFARFYPNTANILTDYYLSLEKEVANGGTVQFYGGIADAIKGYLKPYDFMAFDKKLDQASKACKDEERKRLNELLTAFNYTKLMLMHSPYIAYNKTMAAEYLQALNGYRAFDNMYAYREAFGNIGDFIACYNDNPHALPAGSKVAGKRLTLKSKPDEGYENTALLTDRKAGLPCDYHAGWLISSAPSTIIEVPALGNASPSSLTIAFMQANKWHIYLPESVAIYQDGAKICEKKLGTASNFSRTEISLPATGIKPAMPFEIRLKAANKSRATVACDEIAVF